MRQAGKQTIFNRAVGWSKLGAENQSYSCKRLQSLRIILFVVCVLICVLSLINSWQKSDSVSALRVIWLFRQTHGCPPSSITSLQGIPDFRTFQLVFLAHNNNIKFDIWVKEPGDDFHTFIANCNFIWRGAQFQSHAFKIQNTFNCSKVSVEKMQRDVRYDLKDEMRPWDEQRKWFPVMICDSYRKNQSAA